MLNHQVGKLYIVATPIGNLKDITYHAVEILREVDRILCEDTRHTAYLLNHFSIKKPTLSLHQFNEKSRLEQIFNYLASGENLALVSDAGTPLISDPGFELVHFLKQKGINIIPIPGPCAFITALSASGIPCEQFIFEGFMPAKSNSRREALTNLKDENHTLVFYEAPHRLLAALADMKLIFGPTRQACVAKEITKIHEMILMGKLEEIESYFIKNKDRVKGEMVIIVTGSTLKPEKNRLLSETLLARLLKELTLKKAVEITSDLTGERKNELYQLALKFKADE